MRARRWVTSFERSNLELAVRQRGSADVATNLGELIAARRAGGPAEPTIVYTITRGDAEKVAQVLEARARAGAARLCLAAMRRARSKSVRTWLAAMRRARRRSVRASYCAPRRRAGEGAQENGFAGRVGHYHSTAADKARTSPWHILRCWHASPRLSTGADRRKTKGSECARPSAHPGVLG